MYKITGKRRLNDNMTWLEIEAPLVARKALPGQFIILRTDEKGERIPLTMAGYSRDKGTVEIIYAAVGRTTMLLDQLNEGDFLCDVAGPLGRPTEMEGLKRVCVVGGGTGNALAFGLVKGLHTEGIKVDTIAGFKSRDFVILEKEFNEISENLYIVTDDGSYKEKAFTTDKLKQLLADGNNYDEIIAVGPPVMMKLVCGIAQEAGIRSVASLTAYMIDGTGMCGGCRVIIGGESRFVCVDGPEFDGSQVDWDDLIMRNGFYREEEAEERSHICRLTGGVRYND
ncbi:MAG: sulfide/dihydroorotate dehydrogenase-like FAD/NAD-binding protein [Clostridia bacterium]|nr:sulfide/dihydroorotate dehydrogenase-like FAD/NAD-binding protein [Clostridia bacterium]MDY2932888.1 sulfide/dihydroorotate dehydrogenase-like FAD/NAD-binding protein [Anaerovoracaceae bacterium]